MAYDFLHGNSATFQFNNPWTIGEYPYAISLNGETSGLLGLHSQKYSCELKTLKLAAESTTAVVSFEVDRNDRLPSVNELVNGSTIEFDRSSFPLRNVLIELQQFSRSVIHLVFPPLPSLSGELILHLPNNLTFTPLNTFSTDNLTDEKYGPNVWGVMAITSLLCLIVSSGSQPVAKHLEELRQQWKLLDDERNAVAERLGSTDDATAIQLRRASAYRYLDNAQTITTAHFEDLLRAQITALWFLLGGIIIAIAAFIFLISSRSWLTTVSHFFNHSVKVTTEAGSLSSRVNALEVGRDITANIIEMVVAIGGWECPVDRRK